MAGNPLYDMFRIRELRSKIFFTLGMLIIFRLGAILPIPGIDASALSPLLYESGSKPDPLWVLREYLDFFGRWGI